MVLFAASVCMNAVSLRALTNLASSSLERSATHGISATDLPMAGSWSQIPTTAFLSRESAPLASPSNQGTSSDRCDRAVCLAVVVGVCGACIVAARAVLKEYSMTSLRVSIVSVVVE